MPWPPYFSKAAPNPLPLLNSRRRSSREMTALPFVEVRDIGRLGREPAVLIAPHVGIADLQRAEMAAEGERLRSSRLEGRTNSKRHHAKMPAWPRTLSISVISTARRSARWRGG
jgi:hypothetical protein